MRVVGEPDKPCSNIAEDMVDWPLVNDFDKQFALKSWEEMG